MPSAMATCDLDRPVGLGATPFPLPLHFGHECVGEVLAVGEAVRTVRPGDRVAVPFQISCGTCLACRNRLTGNCRSVPPMAARLGFEACEPKASDGVRRPWSSTPAQIRAVWWRPFRPPRPTGSAVAPAPCTLR
jgi:threonine dehydrogenase-like Zn-dependent dehydrogenase